MLACQWESLNVMGQENLGHRTLLYDTTGNPYMMSPGVR